MKNELQILLAAVLFYTRIPVSKWGKFKEDNLNKATRYFPLIGLLVGGISFLIFWGAQFLWSSEIAVLCSLAVGVLLTGAFHEDGFGDSFDGFGGGWTKTQILTIMKDSRIGSYGAWAIVFLVLLKFFALYEIVQYASNNITFVALVFLCYHAWARTTAISLSFILPYSREDEKSKAKPIAKSFSWKEVIGAFIFGSIPLLLLCTFSFHYLWIIPVSGIIVWYAHYYFKKWIDGYTGDALGAVEQFAELFILLTILCLCKFI